MIDKVRFMLVTAYKAGVVYDQFTRKEFESNRLLGEIVRYTHSIEKGLSIENVRLGFGYAKIKEAEHVIRRYKALNGTIDMEQIQMFVDALSDYLAFHRGQQFCNSQIGEVAAIYKSLSNQLPRHDGKLGGIFKISKFQYTIDEREAIKKVIVERHSVREFDGTPVSEVDLKSAIELAMHCPNACNRQCYRVNVIGRSEFSLLDGWLDGVGGFADDLGKMLLITGCISDYRPTEQLQYIVTPAVFAAYLTITLQAYGIGCCFIQRTLLPNKKYKNVVKKLHIPEDEQAVCILGIGNLKEEYKVPVSHRFDYDKIVRNLSGGG